MLMFRSGQIARQNALACCDQIRWLIEYISLEAGELTVNGWAVVPADEKVEAARFLVGGQDFEHLNYPVPSPDLAKVSPAVFRAHASRFFSHSRITDTTFIITVLLV